ncbi:hypothetical protein E8E14_010829 [Neopestalotiopsis sp. 37M]|nr:hypothetical protein E8E14_010829 [Neopestalotiopsis sp. 37M]
MCFVEFIGYVCGHRSQPVLRPCPLTANHGSNPVCPSPAERPQLLDANCPACARILHGRWVEIVTLEHQYMHERGACACGIRFPADKFPPLLAVAGQPSSQMMVAPSVVSEDCCGTSVRPATTSSGSSDVSSFEPHQRSRSGDSTPSSDESGTRPQMNNQDQSNEKYSQKSKYKTTDRRRFQKSQKARNKNRRQREPQGSRGRQQQHRDSTNSTTTTTQPDNSCGMGSSASAVDKPPSALSWHPSMLDHVDESIPSDELPRWQYRTQSQYGAEWLSEHQTLHISGQCRCPVQFESYKPVCEVTEDDVAAAQVEHGGDLIATTKWRSSSSDDNNNNNNNMNKKQKKKKKKKKKKQEKNTMSYGDNDDVARQMVPIIPEHSDLLVWQMNQGVPKSQRVFERYTLKQCGFANLAQAEAWWYSYSSQQQQEQHQQHQQQQQRDDEHQQQQNKIYAYTGKYSIAGPKPQRTYPIIAYSSPQTHAAHQDILSRQAQAAQQQQHTPAKAYRGVLDATASPFVASSNMGSGSAMMVDDAKNQTTTKYHQDHGVPLAGLPIGVGPEGLDEYSRSPEWDMCASARPKRVRTQSCPPARQ